MQQLDFAVGCSPDEECESPVSKLLPADPKAHTKTNNLKQSIVFFSFITLQLSFNRLSKMNN
jgi:hypothetical protein